MAKELNEKVYVERETYLKDGKSYWSYFIKTIIRGKDVRVAVVPPDFGGYQVMDIVFGDDNKALLVTKPYEMTDEKTGKIISGNTFGIQNVDEDGEVYECTIQAYRKSDKNLLAMLIR